MIETAQLPSLIQSVLIAALVLGVLLGYVMQKTHFCTMGAIADYMNFESTARLRMAALAVGLAIIGAQSLSAFGVVDLSKSIYTGGRLLWLAAAVGGLCFGFGMVLAGGCGSKTLLRMGSGSLKGVVVFLIMGLFAYFTLRGILAVLRVNVLEAAVITLPAQDLPRLLGLSGALKILPGLVLGGGLIVWALLKPEGRERNVLLGGVAVGLLGTLAWYVSGKMGYLTEHPESLQEAFLATNSGRLEALSFVAPSAYWIDYLAFFSDKSKVLTIGLVVSLGVVLGALFESIQSKTFRWEGFTQTRDLAQHLIGAALMGFGGVLAMGCTIGQGLSGVSTLSIGSFIAVAGIVLGAIAALKYQNKVLEAQA